MNKKNKEELSKIYASPKYKKILENKRKQDEINAKDPEYQKLYKELMKKQY